MSRQGKVEPETLRQGCWIQDLQSIEALLAFLPLGKVGQIGSRLWEEPPPSPNMVLLYVTQGASVIVTTHCSHPAPQTGKGMGPRRSQPKDQPIGMMPTAQSHLGAGSQCESPGLSSEASSWGCPGCRCWGEGAWPACPPSPGEFLCSRQTLNF